MRDSKSVVITDYTFPSLDIERGLLSSVGAVLRDYQAKDEQEVIEALRGAEVVLTQFAPIGRRAIEALGPGATVIRYGVGVDNIDLEAAQERGVNVAYVPDYCIDEVADHTVASLLALLRKLKILDHQVRAGRWDPVKVAKPLLPFRETLVGFVGLGRIGRGVLERLRVFGFQFVVHDPYLSPDDTTELGIESAELNEMLAKVDALSLHVPLTSDTHHLVDAERLSRMKSTAVVVNTARGALIDANALAEALRRGTLAGAALDVFETEPLPGDSPLRNSPNILLSPHVAWYSEDSLPRLQRLAAEEAVRALLGEPLRCPIKLG